jgi:hypothetical protein
MGRLLSFDYTKPFFYMVTLKRLPGLAPLSQITDAPEPPHDSRGRERYLIASDLTMAFATAIRSFAANSPGLWPIETFIVMPDHLHILFHLKDTGGRLALAAHVEALAAELSRIYYAMRPGADGKVHLDSQNSHPSSANQSLPSIFSPDWHDWIIMRDGQLAAFTRYIRENPKRAWLRNKNRQFFTRPGNISFAGREWFAYGNPAILELPFLEAFRCSRSWKREGREWRAALSHAERIGPGGAGIGTFMSPCEKECGNAIYKAGGSFVILSPEGFGERWHPPRAKETLCADGRMLYLSLYAPEAARPDNATLHHRCHEMGDIVVVALSAKGNSDLRNSDGNSKL